jgi:hypothetical protein
VLLLRRLPFVLAAVVVCALGTAYFAFPRWDGHTIRIPNHRPADPGSWHWPGGVPGWTPGPTIHDYNVAGVQPVEVEAARLAAARNALDSDKLRVLVGERIDRSGALAIVAAPTLYRTPTEACLGAILRDAPVHWLCPQQLGNAHVLVAARHAHVGESHSLALVGVARGDVTRVELATEDTQFPGRWPIYDRGKTWGEFEANIVLRPHSDPRLLIYGERGLLQTLELPLQPNEQRVLR